jgi:hypothetical protein
VVRRGTASATQTMTGGPPPCLIVAPDLLCSLKAFALRSTRHPLSNHPHKPLPPMVPKSLVDPCLGDTPRRRTGIGSREPRTSRPQDLKRPSGDLPGAPTPSPRGSAEETPAASTPSPQRSAGASDGRFNPHCLAVLGQLTRATVYWYKLPHVPVLDGCSCGPSMRGWVRPVAINGRPLGGGNSFPTLLSWKGPVLDGS